MQLIDYLSFLAEKEGSDLFFTVGAPVNIKIGGITSPLSSEQLTHGSVQRLAYSLLTDARQKEFERELELNVAIHLPDIGRFRLNLYRQRGEVSMVVRFIRNRIPTIDALNMPAILKDLVMEPRGLILVVGATGSGKSTTLAAMIDHRNEHRTGHILTVEEPIEYVYEHKKSVVDQREVGLDTLSYDNALKNAMREAPDVILIGEIRDRETMQHAISYAETGHLCLSTLHANNTNQAIDRIINFFPDSSHQQLLLDLSLNLRAVISQRLLKTHSGGLVPAVELLIRSPYIADLISKREIERIKEAIEDSNELGMQTFDQSLFSLYKAGLIARDEALDNADSRNNLSIRINLSESNSNDHSDSHLSLNPMDEPEFQPRSPSSARKPR